MKLNALLLILGILGIVAGIITLAGGQPVVESLTGILSGTCLIGGYFELRRHQRVAN